MHLLRTRIDEAGHGNFELFEAHGRNVPPYAILSHTWGRDEVLFEHVRNGTTRHHEAYNKVHKAVQQAASDGLEYIWIDSCCIDKSSSAELSEAINSMYMWYQRAEKCYAILETVPTAQHPEFEAKFASCRWFTRGWTLQELLAPEIVEFFGHDDLGSWSYLGDRVSLEGLISTTTSISRDYLRHQRAVSTASIAERMCWAANRQTTREEDIAYCLLGLFSVNMPMLYGEGSRAFLRLQEEILKNSDDQSIFAWTTSMANQSGIEDPQVSLDMVELIENNFYVVGKGPGRGNHHGLLADDPTAFARSGRVVRMQNEAFSVFQMTNRGLRISLPLASVYGLDDLGRNAQRWGARIALLQCRQADGDRRQLGVYLRGVPTGQQASIGQYARVGIGKLAAIGAGAEKHRLEETELFVSQMPLHRPSHHRSAFCLLHRLDGIYRATRIETLDVSDGEDLLDRYPSETVSARSWVPTEFPTVFRIPNADQAFLKIRLENEKERDWVEILIGGNCKDSKTIWGEMSSNARLSEPQKGRFVSQKAYGSDNSDRVQLVEREHADGERKLFLLDIKVGFEARNVLPVQEDDGRLAKERAAWHLYTRPGAYQEP